MSGGAVILMYHRIAERQEDPWSLCVSPGHFVEHLEVLSRHAHPMRLQTLVQALREGAAPASAMVVTFDDGYADNLACVQPLLERYDVPATAFLATGLIGQPREFWWDELERILLETGNRPETLRLELQGQTHEWSFGPASHYSGQEARRHRNWRALDDPPTRRHKVYRELWDLLRPLRHEERVPVMDALSQWAGMQSDVPARDSYRPLLRAEVEALSSGLIEIGAHTATHPLLPTLPLEEQMAEIGTSKVAAEALAGAPITSFSYPYGGYTEETQELVRKGGFACACSTDLGAVSPGSDIFALPRMQVEDWDGEEFARRLVAELSSN